MRQQWEDSVLQLTTQQTGTRDLNTILAQAGLDGWELIWVDKGGSWYQYILKRPKQAGGLAGSLDSD